ncbi:MULTISPECIES: TonB-dependent receptor [unclassified Lysobacter]|uniref:TonB-dependent receptor n=1 Tax=unclassified Lysobacter TaxID=2635362 RepID=UPI001C24E68C|nr:TonB-dependent receptor [Lysobacter sp. MMG2]MBU8975030.1 TonB-dependent receptor [Lysobacter sp. MMG2]
MARKLRLTLAIVGALSLACAATPAAALQSPSSVTRFAIPAGTLDHALQSLATQSRVQVMYAPELVGQRRSAGLQASLSAEQALSVLLRDTGLRAVQVTPGAFLIERAPAPAVAPPPPPEPAREPVELATVEVTGTHIPRASIDVVTPAPLTRISRAQIEASGYQTLFELLSYQPGMISHHPVDVATDGGFQSQQPFAAAATTSLYGLGPRATLILIDGRRVANYGLASADLGGLTDLNGIPLTMVDRIEIMRGGASAIYGADAMAGVINIILKKQQTGGEIAMRYGLSEHGDAEQRRLSLSYGQETARGGNFFLAADYFHRDALQGSDRQWRTADLSRYGLADRRIPLGYFSFFDMAIVQPLCPDDVRDADGQCFLDVPRYLTLQPELESGAVYARLRQPLGGTVEFDGSLRLGQVQQRLQAAPLHGSIPLPPGHPDDLFPDMPTQLDYAFFDVGPVRSRSDSRTVDLDLGLSGLWREWEWRGGVSHHRNRVDNQIDGLISNSALSQALMDYSYRFNSPDNSPEVLAALSPRVEVEGDARFDQFTFAINGPWFTLPGGQTQTALGVEWSRDALRNEPDPRMLDGDVALGAQKSRLDDHRYSSAFYAEMSLPIATWLHADAAWRIDHREGYGSETSPMFGLKWNPLETLTVRATSATGYRAPSLFELRRPSVGGGTFAAVEATPGLAPCAIPTNFEGVDYCIVEHGAIENPNLQPETSRSHTLGLVWAPTESFDLSLDRFRIRRRNEIVTTDAVADPESFPLSVERDEQGQLVAINDYFTNVGRTEVEGWELQSEYRLDTTAAGRFTFRLAASYLSKLERQLDPAAPALDYAGHGSPQRSVLAGIEWLRGNWASALNVHQLGPVEIAAPGRPCATLNAEAGKCRTPASTTADVYVAYGGFANWRLSLNIDNVTDREPRNYDPAKGGYDIAYDDPRGRFYLISAAYSF